MLLPEEERKRIVIPFGSVTRVLCRFRLFLPRGGYMQGVFDPAHQELWFAGACIPPPMDTLSFLNLRVKNLSVFQIRNSKVQLRTLYSERPPPHTPPQQKSHTHSQLFPTFSTLLISLKYVVGGGGGIWTGACMSTRDGVAVRGVACCV